MSRVSNLVCKKTVNILGFMGPQAKSRYYGDVYITKEKQISIILSNHLKMQRPL